MSDATTGEFEDLEAPHPYFCTIGELREVRDVYRFDLLKTWHSDGGVSIEVAEALAFLAYRRKGMSKTDAKKAALQVSAVQVAPTPPRSLEEDEQGNAVSSATS
jgi:hypothetical protein